MPVIDLTDARAITIWQPHASAIALGLKRWETRDYACRVGTVLLIHAGAHWDDEAAARHTYLTLAIRRELGDDPRVAAFAAELPRRCIVAVGVVAEVRRVEDAYRELDPVERLLGDYTPGRKAWRLEPAAGLAEPVDTYRGAVGIWAPSRRTVESVAGQLRGAQEKTPA